MSLFKSGYASVIGLPNVGKSSLVNALVREAVTIVTAKPQTTRKRTLGILTEPHEYQIIFVDTPGMIKSESGLNKFLREEIAESLKDDVDVIIGAMAPWEFEEKEKSKPWALETLENTSEKRVIFVVTQSDRFQKNNKVQEDILKRWNEWTNGDVTRKILFTSCKSGLGLKSLKEEILLRLPQGPQYFEEDLFTTQSLRDVAAETVRKHCFELLHQEIPYGLAVLVQNFKEEKDITRIEADILVTKENHKGMTIGQGGRVLKEIGSRARCELESLLKQKVFLKLHVTVKPHWLKDKNFMEQLGYSHG